MDYLISKANKQSKLIATLSGEVKDLKKKSYKIDEDVDVKVFGNICLSCDSFVYNNRINYGSKFQGISFPTWSGNYQMKL